MHPARTLLILALLLFAGSTPSSAVQVEGALRRWHPVTLTFDGPRADEEGTTNPFRDYRLSVTFTHAATGTDLTVPGYFAADGKAAETSATGGTKWRVHFTPHETENDLLLDNGDLGPERRLYYRELVARFAHHRALNWNLGEENDTWEERDDPGQERIKAYIRYLHALDPYDHPVVIHTYPGQQEQVYGPLLVEASELDGVSIQTPFDNVHAATQRWVQASAESGTPWVVANDEQGHHTTGVTPDGPDSNRDAIRQQTLWGNLMGGAGVEYYFGYEYPHNDLNAEDWRSRDRVWNDVRHALTFFRSHVPFWTMDPADTLASGSEAYVLADPGEVYVVYLLRGGSVRLDLGTSDRAYTVHWYDPRSGGALQTGSVTRVSGPGIVALGPPPSSPRADWVILVRQAR